MANQTIPIVLMAAPVPTPFNAADINQLMTAIATYMSGAIRADVTFIPQVVNDPAALIGNDQQLIFNIPQRVFKGWDAGTGRYLAVTEHQIGDVKNAFSPGDDITHGWVVLDGRLISAISGITGAQQQALNNVFNGGVPGGTLPTVTPANVANLPVGNAFGIIPWPTILPAAGVFSPGLTFTNPVTDAEADLFASDAEILRTTTDNVFTLVKQIQAVAQQMLTAMNAPGVPPLYALCFCGYP